MHEARASSVANASIALSAALQERQAIMRVLAMAIQGILSEQEALVFAGSCVQRLSSGHSD